MAEGYGARGAQEPMQHLEKNSALTHRRTPSPKPAAMPSHSSLTSSEKSLVKKHAPTSQGDKIHAAAIGRVYYAFPDPTKWSYSGISGAVVFGWGQAGGWLKVVDLAVSGASLTRPAE
jgi:hypothetical protein